MRTKARHKSTYAGSFFCTPSSVLKCGCSCWRCWHWYQWLSSLTLQQPRVLKSMLSRTFSAVLKLPGAPANTRTQSLAASVRHLQYSSVALGVAGLCFSDCHVLVRKKSPHLPCPTKYVLFLLTTLLNNDELTDLSRACLEKVFLRVLNYCSWFKKWLYVTLMLIGYLIKRAVLLLMTHIWLRNNKKCVSKTICVAPEVCKLLFFQLPIVLFVFVFRFQDRNLLENYQKLYIC